MAVGRGQLNQAPFLSQFKLIRMWTRRLSENIRNNFILPAKLVARQPPGVRLTIKETIDVFVRLGINIERIKPGNPQQNGRHERMHLTLKNEATNPPGFSFLQQQDKFVSFIDEYNNDRPHQSLNMKYPAELYTPSTKVYRPPEPPDYPYHDKTIRVTQCGRICLNNKKISFSRVFAGQLVGVREVNDKIWLVSFMEFDLGYFDEDDCRVEPLDSPFADRVLPM